MEIGVTPKGLVQLVYDETFDFSQLGSASIQRASHVEPAVDGTWWADLKPVGGPKLGPFALRSRALSAEHTWLTAHLPTLSLTF